jgi:hypothetical protein
LRGEQLPALSTAEYMLLGQLVHTWFVRAVPVIETYVPGRQTAQG